MKRVIAFLCITAMLSCSFTACSDTDQSEKDQSETAQSRTDYSDQTLTGKVIAVDGTLVAVQLGELSDNGGGGESMQMPDIDESEPADGNTENGATPPEMPDSTADGNTENGETPPEMPDSTADGNTENGATPPEMPDSTADGNTENGETPPELPDGEAGGSEDAGASNENALSDTPEGQQGGEMMQMPGDEMGSSNGFTANGATAIVDISGATINSDTEDSSERSIDDIVVGTILSIQVDSNNTVSVVTILSVGENSGFGGSGDMAQGAPAGGNNGFGGDAENGGFGGSGDVTQGTSANTIDTAGEYSDISYSSTGDDENALRVDGAKVTLNGITVDKSAGSSSNTENGDFYGMNAALLATNGANVTITNATITSSAQNGNGVFSYGTGTVVNISDSTITTTADNSGGIQTTGGGTTNASNLTVETSGSSAAAIRSDRGGGTVNVDGGTYTSNGYNSPAVYSTAAITVKNAVLTANHSEALVIEGENSITLENCDVSGNMSDDKGTSSDENVHTVMIYQSMSGDANVGTSSFSMTGGSLLSNNGDLFYITNTACTVYLSGVDITNKEENGYLMNICGNSASHGWGTAGQNGAQVVFTADGQTLEGDIVVDTISTLNMTLSGNSSFTGTVNIVDNAQGGTTVSDNAVVTVESGSTWTLTGNCTITSLTNRGTIDFNGFTITLADGTVLSGE